MIELESWYIETSKKDIKQIIEYLQNIERANLQDISIHANIDRARLGGYIRCLAVLSIINIDQRSLNVYCSLNRNSRILKSIDYKKTRKVNWKMIKDRLIMFGFFLLSVILGNFLYWLLW